MTAPLAYYNENDPYAAQYLRNLVDAGHVAFGVVDERSIEDVTPQELEQYTQCHFFAGVGIWSLALRMAGWPDNRPVWTGSCPCQPFSTAGKRAGFDDERHLWPSWHWLVQQCKPADIFGEQVASKAVEPWIDLVQADLEAMGYAFGCVPFPSAGVGAPHIRDRAFWMANTPGQGPQRFRHGGHTRPGREGTTVERSSQDGRLADTKLPRTTRHGEHSRGAETQEGLWSGPGDSGFAGGPGPTNGFWSDVDWLYCRDGKWRPVEPGTFPLAHGATARVGRLRAYGNAINAIQAAEFIGASMS